MNKTAMQILESKYEANKSEYVSVTDLLAEIRNMLPTERQQIEDAFKGGYRSSDRCMMNPHPDFFKNYYTKTYGDD